MRLFPMSFFLWRVDYALDGLVVTEQMWFLPLFSYCGVVTRILIFCGYCFWSTWFASWCKNIFFELFWNVKLFIAKLISQAPEDAILKIKRSVYERLFKSRATCRPKRRCKSNLWTISVLANRSLHQNLMHSGCRGRAVPNVCEKCIALDFSNGVFDFQNETDMDLTQDGDSFSSGWSAILKAGTLRHMSWPNERDREGLFRGSCLNNHQSSRINVKRKQKYLFQRRNYRTLRSSPKAH